MKYWCAANWKMNKTPEECEAFLKNLKLETKDCGVIIFPQNFSIPKCAEILNDKKNIIWGSQNCYFENEGAFTGENSPKLLKQMGAKSVLVGHSERRIIFDEDNVMIAKKMKACCDMGLMPVLCVGENKNEDTKKVLKEQITTALSEIQNHKIIIAYEPVWAIGTGNNIEPSKLTQIASFIKKIVKPSIDMKLLYGGSVKEENARQYASISNLDGFLVGGASLKLDRFMQILHILHEVKGG